MSDLVDEYGGMGYLMAGKRRINRLRYRGDGKWEGVVPNWAKRFRFFHVAYIGSTADMPSGKVISVSIMGNE